MAITYAKNGKLTLNGESLEKYGYQKKDKWYAGVTAVLDKIYGNDIGKKVIASLGRTEIKPYEFDAGLQNAKSLNNPITDDIWYGHDDFWDASKPGCAPEEILFHEMIHLLESCKSNYEDARDGSFKFDGADFNTVNATNVYASTASAAAKLRKDHQGFNDLPLPFSGSSSKFFMYFWKNFKTANSNNSDLYDILSNSGASWNPYLDPVEPEIYEVAVKEKSWRWNYYIFVDVRWQSGRAFWDDKVNPAKFGFGTWRQNGAGRRITWESGSWDEMPAFDSEDGRTKTGGFEYRTKVTRPLW